MVDLSKVKERRDVVVNLKKDMGIPTQKAQVVLALDFSGSMSSLYSNGTVQDTVERILPLGLAFDDNGEIDFYLFENGSTKMPENITLKNLDGYIQNKIIGKYSMGGTNYSPVLRAILNDFAAKKEGSFLGIGGKPGKMKDPVYIIFITDGDNSDRTATEQIVREMSEQGFFIQFVGIGHESFSFLQKLDDLSGRKIDNANFFKIKDIKNTPDSQLYPALMNEFPGWVAQAKNLNLIE
jgi:hypothetical protein